MHSRPIKFTIADASYNSEVNASHVLDAAITKASFVPDFGWAIGRCCLIGDCKMNCVKG